MPLSPFAQTLARPVASPVSRCAVASLIEAFSSLQGEGPYVGRRQLFVRFAGCHLACAYCDTTLTPDARGMAVTPLADESPSFFVENPLTPEALLSLMRPLLDAAPHHSVSLTGGEPLLYADFLRELAPALSARVPLYLETSGTHVEALADILPWVDIIAMDVKLASATGEPSPFAAHARFLDVARSRPQTRTFIKLVVGPYPPAEELAALGAILPARGVPVILQPVTRPDGSLGASAATLMRLQRELSQSLDDVRVIPQTHKVLGIA
ncbi:MAG: 7-carboxy-7-deazaguanine synthase QueE [Vampirovibrionales bacterium]|nr:7-carboxy-7-deazaguanine synthase QueE [Vampirovibrionales bacterium]